MIKTLFASLCVAACCMGNEYPAKAVPADFHCIHTESGYANCVNRAWDHEREMDSLRREIKQEIRDEIRYGIY